MYSLNTKYTMTYDVGNLVLGLGQVQNCVRVKPFHGIIAIIKRSPYTVCEIDMTQK
jgi:hypothetical protein